MFKKIFGETEEMQLAYLQKRVILTVIAVSVAAVIGIFSGELEIVGGAFGLAAMFIWGFGAIKALFGITTVGAIFSRNVVIGVILFVLLLAVAFFTGVFIGILGIGRYIYLMVNKSTGSSQMEA